MIKTAYAAKDFDPYLFVKYSDETHVTPATSSTDNLLGVKTNIPALKDQAADVVLQGAAELRLGGTVHAGDRLTCDANGQGITVTTEFEATEAENVITVTRTAVVKAIALADGVTGDIIPVCVV